MDELANQLRRLGEATESEIAPVTAHEATAMAADQVTDLDQADSSGAPTSTTGHRKRSGRRLLAAAAAIVAVAAVSIALSTGPAEEAAIETASQPAPDPAIVDNDNGWEKLRQCESTGNYRVDTGNSFYGAYQFTRGHWDSTAAAAGLDGYVGTNPAAAPPAVQDALAATLYLSDGAEPWPVCGRFLKGPMNTPVIPQWLEQPADFVSGLIVFLEPGSNGAEVQATSDAIAEIVARDPAITMQFVSQAEAYQEYEELFGDYPHVVDSTDEGDMPPSIRLSGPGVASLDNEALRDISNVFEVVEASPPPTYAGVGQRLVIESIDVDVPVSLEPTVTNLTAGVALHRSLDSSLATVEPVDPLSSFLGPVQRTTVIVGYQSGIHDAPFDRLAELRRGDIIELHTLLDLTNHEVRIEKYRIAGPASTPSIAPPWGLPSSYDRAAPAGAELLLVTTGQKPEERLIYLANPLPIDTALFGVDLAD